MLLRAVGLAGGVGERVQMSQAQGKPFGCGLAAIVKIVGFVSVSKKLE
jgi:hypothetical protein